MSLAAIPRLNVSIPEAIAPAAQSSDADKYYSYRVVTKVSGQTFTRIRKLPEFVNLSNAIIKRYSKRIELPIFPKKKGKLGDLPEMVESRRLELQYYMQDAVKFEEIRAMPDVVDFLGIVASSIAPQDPVARPSSLIVPAAAPAAAASSISPSSLALSPGSSAFHEQAFRSSAAGSSDKPSALISDFYPLPGASSTGSSGIAAAAAAATTTTTTTAVSSVSAKPVSQTGGTTSFGPASTSTAVNYFGGGSGSVGGSQTSAGSAALQPSPNNSYSAHYLPGRSSIPLSTPVSSASATGFPSSTSATGSIGSSSSGGTAYSGTAYGSLGSSSASSVSRNSLGVFSSKSFSSVSAGGAASAAAAASAATAPTALDDYTLASSVHPPNSIHAAVESSELDRVLRMVSADRSLVNSLNTNQQTPLHIASINGSASILQLLLENQANPNISDVRGWTALHCACSTAHMDCITALLRANAKLSCSTNMGFSPLHFFVAHVQPQQRHAVDVLRQMLDLRADPGAGSTYNVTPLHEAARTGNMAFVDELLSKSARRMTVDIDVRDKNGDTPIHYATRARRHRCIQHLTKLNANISLRGLEGTPLEMVLALREKARKDKVAQVFIEGF